MYPMMKCGHAANSTCNGKPSCAICVPRKEAFEIAETPNLAGRKSCCAYCRKLAESSTDLPFFEHRPTRDTDSHYCGCRGWN